MKSSNALVMAVKKYMRPSSSKYQRKYLELGEQTVSKHSRLEQ